jgi:capsular exopolysaccharide synthesis family protein
MPPQDGPPPLEDDELDLRAYLGVLRRRWVTIAAVVVVAVVAALLLAVREESRYRADAELLIRQNESSALVDGTPVVNANEAERALNNEVELFESGTVEQAVHEAYDGPLDPEAVKATVAGEASDVLRASVVSTDPDEAERLLDRYVQTFIEVRRSQETNELLAVGTEIQAKIDELAAQITEVRRPLEDLDAQLGGDPENQGLIDQREELARELSPRLAPLESRRSFYQSQLEDLELTADITRTGGAQLLTAAEATESPVSPKPVRDATIALVLGLVLGVGVAFLRDSLDERIRSVADLEQIAHGVPTLALVPEVEKGHDNHFVAVRDDPRSVQAESFRSLRTAVKFAALDSPIKVLQITSPSQGEGKTTAVANLAVALAQGGDRVAVVCCDLRRPRVQDRFDVPLTPGLTDVLVGDATLGQALRRYEQNVLILPAGTPPPNPSELLSSNTAGAVIRALAEEFDVVLVDSTPVLPVTDALVVNRLVDATVVVVDSRRTARKAVRRCLQLLGQVNAPVLGLVLNGLPAGGQYGYGYGYGYRYESTSDTRRLSRRETERA